MSKHETTLYYQTGGKTTLTCSCGKFKETVGRDYGKPPARESHLRLAHRQHVEKAT